jgi:hypothetical protein
MLKAEAFILFIFCSTFCSAQIDSIYNSHNHKFNYKISYNSSLIYPGLSTGIEFSFKQVNVQKFGKRLNNNFFTKGRFISGNLNWYHHPDFHDNIYITAEWVMRRTKSGGFISEFSAGPGFSRTFLGGTTYRVADNGDITVIKLAGYNYALITIGGGFGYDFSPKKQLPLETFAKMNLISMFPYNSTIYFRPVLELGVRYTPGKIRNYVRMESIMISERK